MSSLLLCHELVSRWSSIVTIARFGAAIEGSIDKNVPQFRRAFLPVLRMEDIRPALHACMSSLDMALVPASGFAICRVCPVAFNDADLHRAPIPGHFHDMEFVAAHGLAPSLRGIDSSRNEQCKNVVLVHFCDKCSPAPVAVSFSD